MFWFFVALGAVAIVIFFMRLYEITINKQLHNKQVALRVKQNVLNNGVLNKLGLPLVTGLASVVFAVLLFGGSNINYSNEYLTSLSGKNDLIALINQYEEDSFYDYFPKGGWATDDMALEENFADSDIQYTEDLGSSDYSTTNVQVIGVDESDNALTDGTYLYSLSKNRVMITRIFDPSSTEELVVDLTEKKVIEYLDYGDDLENEYHYEHAFNMYVDEDYLVVLVYTYDFNQDYYGYWGIEPAIDVEWNIGYYYYSSYVATTAYVYDKADNFELLNKFDFDGNFVGTRKIDENLFVITTEYIYSNTIEDKPADEIIPNYEIDDTDYTIDYSDVTYIEGTEPNQFINIYGIDLDHGEVDQNTFLGSGYMLYVSTQNIYITQTKWTYNDSIFETSDWDVKQTTEIIKVAINGNNTNLVATSSVPGYVVNQFSMDERDGNFRIATTEGDWWNQTGNNVYVLDETLEIIGKVENLAQGERIYSVRYIGDYAYIVTFKQVDPLFTIDLSDPTNPLVMDELKVTGFSTYLHPYDNGLLLGLGYESDLDGRIIGLKMALFDVSDPENAVEIDREVILYENFANFGWAYSSALYNHKDLLIDKNKGIIGLPLEFNGYNELANRYEYNQGYALFDINVENDDVFTLNGYVLHDFSNKAVDEESKNVLEEEYYWYYNYFNRIYKGMYVEDYLFTVSELGIVVSTLEDSEVIVDIYEFPIS